MHDVLQELTDIIEERLRSSDDQSSYVAKLGSAGLDKILEKVGEESIEVILAAKHAEQFNNNEKLIHESADLLFHTLVMLASLGANINQVLDELATRFGTSGLEEKRLRREQD
ncbi:MAG: phosphoribosyl-ATP diphosphatase [Pseudomonadales bacterium]